MMKSIAFCQIDLNSKFPKTITGAVDFGEQKYAVFTLSQKAKILECIISLDECEQDRILDSIIIEAYGEKRKIDSITLDLCEKRYASVESMYNISQEALATKQKELDAVNIELKKAEKKAKRQNVLKKIGVSLGTTLGFAGGVLVGYFANDIKNKIGN